MWPPHDSERREAKLARLATPPEADDEPTKGELQRLEAESRAFEQARARQEAMRLNREARRAG